MLDKMRENASGWIVKILFAIIIIVFVFAFGMSGMNSTGDPVLATVNDQIITRAEFETAYQRMAEAVRRNNPNIGNEQFSTPQFKQLVLGELISKKLLLAEGAKLGISASDAEVFAGISSQPMFKDANGNFDKNVYQGALRQIRMTPSQFENEFKQELIMDKVKAAVATSANVSEEQARQIFNWIGEQVRIQYIQVKASMYVDDIKVSDDEIKAYYDENKDRFKIPEQLRLRTLSFTPAAMAKYQDVTEEEIAAYYAANQGALQQDEQIKARHILIMTKDTDPEDVQNKAKNKIEEIYQMAKAGDDFAALARTYSEGPSGPSGGELGWFGRGAMVPPFEEAAFALGKGEISEPVRTQFGWHIIQVEDIKDASSRELDEVRDELKQQIAEEKASEKVQDLLDESLDRLVSGMKLEAIADELGLEAVTSEPMPANFLARAFGVTPEAAKTIEELAVETSHHAPIAVNGGFMLVEKIEDLPESVVALDKVKQAITAALNQQKALEMAKAEADKIHAALVADSAKAEKTYERRIVLSEPFDRQGNITGLGQSRPLAEAVFAAKDTAWLPEVYPMGASVVIARLDERVPASEDTWKDQKEFWMQQASQTYQQELMAAYMDNLSKTADVQIARPDLLQ